MDGFDWKCFGFQLNLNQARLFSNTSALNNKVSGRDLGRIAPWNVVSMATGSSFKDVFIVGAVRSPIGSFKGALAQLSASEIGAQVIKACLAKAGKFAGSEMVKFVWSKILLIVWFVSFRCCT